MLATDSAKTTLTPVQIAKGLQVPAVYRHRRYHTFRIQLHEFDAQVLGHVVFAQQRFQLVMAQIPLPLRRATPSCALAYLNRKRLATLSLLSATIQRLALLDATFYSTGVFSPTLTISTFSGPIFRMSDAARYATLHASDPNPCPTLASVFFVATLPSPMPPGWR
jgi:hypothetical protein